MFEDSNKIYDNLVNEELHLWNKKQVQLFRFNGLDIPFSPQWKRIAINLSGGADSACLTFFLATIIKENNFDCKIDVITHVRCWNTRPWQGPVSVTVYEKLCSMFPDVMGDRHENFIAPELEHAVSGLIFPDTYDPTFMRSGDQISVGQYNQYCIHRFKLDAIYNATTMNPRTVDFPKKMSDREKDPKDGIGRDLLVSYYDSFMLRPFNFVEKTWVIAQYHLYGITDLLECTRSCEGDITHKKIKMNVPSLSDYTPSTTVPLCGDCFWCLERSWATAKLPSTLEKLKNV